MIQIAIVEDDELTRDVLQRLLEGAGYAVSAYPDGRSALAELPAQSPALVLLDVNLPDMTGPDICRALKAREDTRRARVLLMTGEAREVAQRVAGLDAGADDYLFKPISSQVLLSRVSALLRCPDQEPWRQA